MIKIIKFIVFSAFSIFTTCCSAMEVPQPSDAQTRFIEKLVGYQGLLQAEKEHAQRSLNFMAKYQIGDKIPESELDIQQSIEAYAAIYKSIPLETLSDRKQIIIIFMEILQYDLVFTTYVDKFLGDVIANLSNNKVKISDEIFQSHIADFSKHVACHNQITSNDISTNILMPRNLKDKFDSEFANIIAPRTYFLNDNVWAKLNIDDLHFPELEHQKLNLFLYSQLEADLNAVIGSPSFSPDINISNKVVNGTFADAFISFCSSKNKAFFSIANEELQAITNPSSKASPTASRLRQKLCSKKTFADCLLTSQEIDNFLNKSYKSLSAKLYPPVVGKKKSKNSKKKSIKQIQIVTTPKSAATASPLLKEEAKESLALETVCTETTMMQPTPVVNSQEQTIEEEREEEWDYYKWFAQQSFASKQIITNHNLSSKQASSVLPMPELSDHGQEFYEAVFGLGGKNVSVKHFGKFLKDIGGFKMKMTKQGLKKVDLADTSVEIFYSVPNLGTSKNGTGFLIYKLHQPHGGEEFARRTLYDFLRPQLEAAGYSRVFIKLC